MLSVGNGVADIQYRSSQHQNGYVFLNLVLSFAAERSVDLLRLACFWFGWSNGRHLTKILRAILVHAEFGSFKQKKTVSSEAFQGLFEGIQRLSTTLGSALEMSQGIQKGFQGF